MRPKPTLGTGALCNLFCLSIHLLFQLFSSLSLQGAFIKGPDLPIWAHDFKNNFKYVEYSLHTTKCTILKCVMLCFEYLSRAGQRSAVSDYRIFFFLSYYKETSSSPPLLSPLALVTTSPLSVPVSFLFWTFHVCGITLCLASLT